MNKNILICRKTLNLGTLVHIHINLSLALLLGLLVFLIGANFASSIRVSCDFKVNVCILRYNVARLIWNGCFGVAAYNILEVVCRLCAIAKTMIMYLFIACCKLVTWANSS